MITILKPDYLLHISEGAEDISEALHNEIIKRIINRIMLRINRNDDYVLTAYDKWNIETLQQSGYLLEDIQKEIAKATKLQEKEIAEAMEEAGVKALDYEDKIYQSVGLSPTPLTQSPELIRLMQRNYEATIHTWKNFTRTMADEAQRLFISQLDMAYTLVSTGALSYTQAVKEVLNNIVTDGVVVNYPSGHSDTIETATLRAVRTGVSQATGQITLARMKEMGACLAITSSHLGARPSHAVWQGKVFYVDWKRMDEIYPLAEIPMPQNIDRSLAKKYPDFIESTRIGKVDGLEGANCRHSHSVYYQGMNNPFEQYDSKENLEQYEKEQRQRTLERRIRKSKREVMGWKEAVDNETDDKAKFELDLQYQKKSLLLQKQNEAYREYCEKNNLRPLADRITIARWNRQQAAAARGAAKRYENAHEGSSGNKKIKQIIKPKTVEELNKRTTNALGNAYENHRIKNNTTSVPLKELGEENNIIKANYGNLSMESATAFSDTIESLIQEYDTPLTSIRPMRKEEYFELSGSFAGVTHNYTVDSAELVINVTKCKDYDKLLERIKALSDDGYCVKVLPEKLDSYVATHEFSHTILNMQNKLNNKKNWVNADYDKIRDARKEIENIYESYINKLSEIDSKVKDYESKIFEYMMDGKEAPVEIEKLYNKYYDEYQELIISEYSLANSDEFMAEAFTEAKIGIKKSEYSKKVIEVIDKYFKR